MGSRKILVFYCSVLNILALFCSYSGAAGLDTSKYIPIDEVRADMEAYCLTVFSGTEIERFELQVLSVIRGVLPGQDMILVKGVSDRFQRAGAIHGCSGSPVFIDGRLAGALAVGWDGSLDALYMVRPIADMLQVGNAETAGAGTGETAFRFDYSGPLDMSAIYAQAMEQLRLRPLEQNMLIPLSSSLPSETNESFRDSLGRMRFVPVSAAAAMPTTNQADRFEPGGVMSVVLCGGDISLTAVGTVTQIVGDQIYGFGHPFKGQGPTNLPIAAGIVHTVVAGRFNSFKFSSPGPILGTLEFDQSLGVRGTIGAIPQTIPLTIQVRRDNDPQLRTYTCFLACDRFFTPLILQLALNGAALMQGPLPPEHTVQYDTQICIAGQEPIVWADISSGQGTTDIEQGLFAIIGMLLNNPFEEFRVESIEVNINIASGDSSATIQEVQTSGIRLKPGQTTAATVSLRTFRSEESTATIEFQVPETLPPGRYVLQVMGRSDYQRFVSKMAPQRFRAFDGATLLDTLRRIAGFRSNRLYAVAAIPASGMTLRQHELPELPATKNLLMRDAKRLAPVEPYKNWVQSEKNLDKIVQDAVEIELTVE